MTTRRRLLILIVKLLDVAVVVAALVIAVAATQREPRVEGWLPILQMRVKVQNVIFVLAYLGFWHFTLLASGLYRSYRLSPESSVQRGLVLAVSLAVAPLLPLGSLLHFEYVTSSFLLTFAGLAFTGLALERHALRLGGRWARRHGRNLQNVLVVRSSPQAVAELLSVISRRADLGYNVVGVIDTEGGEPRDSQAVLERLESVLSRTPIDEVFVALALDSSSAITRNIIAACEEQGITVRVVTQLTSAAWSRASLDSIAGIPVLTVHTGPSDSPRLLAKRAIDAVGAFVGFILCAPLFVVVAVLIRLESPGPVFFVQERVGLNRRRFRTYKFRTMVDQAESMQAPLEALNEAQGPVFKIRNDPRITRVGGWLRRLSIDELPQLLNVLRGDMSLVGPRPLPLRDVQRIDVCWHKRRFSVKPGITCLWQINGRKPQFDEWVELDMKYIDNWSLGLDLKILAKTIPAVLSRHGAH